MAGATVEVKGWEIIPAEERGLRPVIGQTLTRVQDRHQFTTAIAVQEPRNIVKIEKAAMKEASLLAGSAYYGWGVGKERVEGGSIGLANMLARVWGNCARPVVSIQETSDCWYFTGVFIDLETGCTLERYYRQSKRSVVYGKMDTERKDDIRFEIGQSKAMRNVVLNALPAWLVQRAIAKAKQGMRDRLEAYIAKEGIENARQILAQEFAKHGVSGERVAAKMGRDAIEGLTIEDMVLLRGDLDALNDGAERRETLFPPIAANGASDGPGSKARAAIADKVSVPGPEKPAKPVEKPAEAASLEVTETLAATAKPLKRNRRAPSPGKPATATETAPVERSKHVDPIHSKDPRIQAQVLQSSIHYALDRMTPLQQIAALNRAGLGDIAQVNQTDDVSELERIEKAVIAT